VLEKLTPQVRMIIATVLSFGFFALYDHFFIPKAPLLENNTTVSQSQTASSSAPEIKVPLSSADVATAPVASVSEGEIIATIKAPTYEVHIDKLGRISKFYLQEGKYKDDKGVRLQLIDATQALLPLEMRFSDKATNNEAFAISYSVDAKELEVSEKGSTLVMTQTLGNVSITKKLTFYPAGNYDIHVTLSEPKEYFISAGFRPSVALDSYTFHGALIKKADSTIQTIDDGSAKGDERFDKARIVASSDKYYTTFMYELSTGLDAVISVGKDKDPLVFIKGNENFKASGYVGPKEYVKLKDINPELTDVVEYGFFTFIAKPLFTLLSFLHGIFGNWGWAIVFMTIIVRLVLYPLTYKGMVSMNKLKELAPKVKELQVKYGDDKQKLNVHMMELYKKHGANPMGGCLPIILQIPVFFAVYRVLQNAIELKGADWILWVQDLAVMDPYFILPVAMGLTMFIHQRITPTTFTDPMQEKIMKFLPLIFTFFFVTFPAGLTLYWFTNNLASIIQQFYVNRIFAKKHEEQKAQI